MPLFCLNFGLYFLERGRNFLETTFFFLSWTLLFRWWQNTFVNCRSFLRLILSWFSFQKKKILTLGIAKVFSTVLETLEALEIKSIAHHLKFSVWVGFIASPKRKLGLLQKLSLTLENAWKENQKYINTYNETLPLWKLEALKGEAARNMNPK